VAAHAKRGKTRDAPSSAGPRKDRKGVDRRRRSCFFCKEKVAAVDYKNIAQLRRFISERGKIKGRRQYGRLPETPEPGGGLDQTRACDGAFPGAADATSLALRRVDPYVGYACPSKARTRGVGAFPGR
jgi:ribosomal protein S18